jgi:hypothetical protein
VFGLYVPAGQGVATVVAALGQYDALGHARHALWFVNEELPVEYEPAAQAWTVPETWPARQK